MRSHFIAFAAGLSLLASPSFAEDAHGDHPGEPQVVLATGQQIDAESVDQMLQDAAGRHGVNGYSVAIVNGNDIVYERSFGTADIEHGEPVTSGTLFEFASMSKPVFAALVADLAAEGVIDLDRPLIDYYPHPDLADEPYAAIMTARHVLTHQTGLPNWRSNNPDGQLDFAFEPGTGYRYSGEGYEYLADVLMHVLELDDRGLDALFRERLAAPAGATDTHFMQDVQRLARKARGYRAGEPVAGSVDYANDGFGAAYSIHSTAADYARLIIGLMQGPSLDEAEREVFFAAQNVPVPEDHSIRQFGFVDQALSYSIHDLPIGRFYVHGGNNEGFTGLSILNPAVGWGYVIVSNEYQANDFNLEVSLFLLDLDLTGEQSP